MSDCKASFRSNAQLTSTQRTKLLKELLVYGVPRLSTTTKSSTDLLHYRKAEILAGSSSTKNNASSALIKELQEIGCQ